MSSEQHLVGSTDPVVSVCVTTYNHERYIRQAIESVLSQVTTFALEVLIGEDQSTDLTRQIVQELAHQFPNTIRPYYNDRKDVIYINGHPTGRRNLTNVLSNAKGKYIAILDGDDYWLDSSKVQQQVDFLESNQGFSMTFHDAEIVDADGRHTGRTYCYGRVKPGEVAIEEMIEANKVPICTALFRSSAILPPLTAETVRAYDWLLTFIAAEHGKIHFDDRPGSAYRVHEKGIWQRMSNLEKLRAEEDVLWQMNLFLGKKQHAAFCDSIATRESRLSQMMFDQGAYANGILHWSSAKLWRWRGLL